MLIRPMLMGAALAAAGGGGLRPQDVFATSLYTGSAGTQTVTNGIDLAGKGGLVWGKQRASDGSLYNHELYDTLRGVNTPLASNTTAAEQSISPTLSAFLSNGFTLGNLANTNNRSGDTSVAWSFRRAPKFFDIVTYTGDGTSGRVIPHGLGIKPGMIIVKRRDVSSQWLVGHIDIGDNNLLQLNRADAQVSAANSFQSSNATSFTIGDNVNLNASGSTYVAYLFAHDPDTTNGIVQCGSYTADGSGNATVLLGWKPQFLLVKNSSTTGNWVLVDAGRGWTASSAPILRGNTTQAELALNSSQATATGFTDANGFAGANATAVYLAIRAPIT